MKLFPFRRKSTDSNEEIQESQPTVVGVVNVDDPTPGADPESGPAAVPSADSTAKAVSSAEAPQDPLAALATPNSDSETAPAKQPEAETSEAAVDPPAPVKQPGAPDDLLAQMSAEADSEIAAEEAVLEGGQKSDDDELDPELLDIFRDAKNEVQEGSLALELDDISTQDLLSEVATISQRLGVPAKGSAASRDRQAADTSSPDESNGPPDGEEQPKLPSTG